MAKRTRIAIPFTYSESWVAGVYYITNLIHALNALEDDLKPELLLISKEQKDLAAFAQTGYPYLRWMPMNIIYSLPERIINKLTRTLLGKNIIRKEYGDDMIDIVFPYVDSYALREVKNKLYWIPDFQEKYYPEFFSKEEVRRRAAYYELLSKSGSHVVFSSRNAMNDFRKFYPDGNCKLHVLHFAVTSTAYHKLDISLVKKKYGISGEYFISPNQFWRHKNHPVVLRAVKLLKMKGHDLTVVFTGKEQDYRNPDYFDQLKSFVAENNLSAHVRFLGFIDRNDQLKLMSSALAVIQPSLFEGWSTVVEDAKEMNQFVLLSDIEVHREQLNYNVSFFDPLKEEELAERMLDVLSQKITRTQIDYKPNVAKFGSDFMQIVKEVVKTDK